MEEIANLTGQKIGPDMRKAIYEKIGHHNVNDFMKAVDSLVESDFKFNLHNLLKHLYKAKNDREEEIDRCEKILRGEEAKSFWKANYKGDGVCSRKCGECPAVYCNTIAAASLKAMKRMLNGEITNDEMHGELIKSFPGAGFENFNRKDVEPF